MELTTHISMTHTKPLSTCVAHSCADPVYLHRPHGLISLNAKLPSVEKESERPLVLLLSLSFPG